MFRVIICVSLIFGITAKPYQPQDKLKDKEFMDVAMSIDDSGKMSWGVEVEPPEDMDEMSYDIDPRMKIWKNMMNKEQEDKQTSEEDLDEMHHPSVSDLLRAQNMDVVPAADIQTEPEQEDAITKYEEPEEDRDEIDHPVFLEVVSGEPEPDWDKVYNGAREVLQYVAHLEAEEDEDYLYHHDDQRSLVLLEEMKNEVKREVRVHHEPEEDLDDLYHKDPSQTVLYQDDAEAAAAPVDLMVNRKYSEPEADLDDLYHQ